MTANVTIDRMQKEDVPRAAELEQMGGDVCWKDIQISAELEKSISRYYVARDVGAGIIGYVGGWVIPPELQIANIVIHPDFRCRGIGRRLLETLVTQAQVENCHQSTLEVRASNAHAQALYRAFGFIETGRRPGLYQGPVEDGILMEKKW